MYSEHLIATVLRLRPSPVTTGGVLDAARGRMVVTLGRVLGPEVGCSPNDKALARYCRLLGTPAPVGTRAAVHLLADGRCALGLGSTRGVIESIGDRLVVVTHPEEGRYVAAWRVPGVRYGGLI